MFAENNKIKYILLDAANTIIYKPNLYKNIKQVLVNHKINIAEVDIEQRHKILSEVINFPDRTSREFYTEFNRELLLLLGVLPSANLVQDIFDSCTYLPWSKFSDCSHLTEIVLPMGVLSNFNSSLNQILADLFGVNFFKDIFVSEKIKSRKPEIDFYKTALEQLGYEASEILYIGDSLKLDIFPAEHLGFKTLLIDRLNLFPGCKNRINSFSDLKNYIKL